MRRATPTSCLACRCLLLVILPLAAGCHTVTLGPISSPTQVPRLASPASPVLDAQTKAYTYEVRSILGGPVDKWTIQVGQALAQYADAYFAAASPPGSDEVVDIKIEKFDVRNFEAHCQVSFTVTRGGKTVFDRPYYGEGNGYAAPVAMFGPFGMDYSMRRTTDEALRSVFEQFLHDAVARQGQGPAAVGAPDAPGAPVVAPAAPPHS